MDGLLWLHTAHSEGFAMPMLCSSRVSPTKIHTACKAARSVPLGSALVATLHAPRGRVRTVKEHAEFKAFAAFRRALDKIDRKHG